VSVQTIHRKPGDLITSATETDLQQAIADETAILGSQHLRTESLNRYHFQTTPGDVTTIVRSAFNSGSTTGTYASATYVPITHDVPMLLDFGALGTPVEDGWAVRYEWSVFVEEFERAGGIGEYAFCLKTDTVGAGTFVQQSPDYWYSAMGYPRSGPSTTTYYPMDNRRHTMSFTQVSSTSYFLFQARVDIKITVPWTTTLRFTNMFATIMRH
jgi:hypothetical protein